MDEKLQELLDKRAIEEVLLRYCRTLDWLDDEGLATVFWPDAHVDYDFFKGTGADFGPAVMAVERASARRWHLGVNAQIKLEGPNKAQVESYGVAMAMTPDEAAKADPTSGLLGGRYLDVFEKRGDEWRIAERTYILDWGMRFADIADTFKDGDFPLHRLDIRDTGHPAYRKM